MSDHRTKRIHCENVEVGEQHRFGEYANGIRVLEEGGPDVLLDFLLFCTAEKSAKVVSRVRVRKEFLPAIQQVLAKASDAQSLVWFNERGPVH